MALKKKKRLCKYSEEMRLVAPDRDTLIAFPIRGAMKIWSDHARAPGTSGLESHFRIPAFPGSAHSDSSDSKLLIIQGYMEELGSAAEEQNRCTKVQRHVIWLWMG